MTRLGQQRFHKARQQPETLGDHSRFRREVQEVFDDQAGQLPLEPVKALKHGLRRSVHPSLVHVHSLEPAQQRDVLRREAAVMVRHRVVSRVHTQAVPVCHPASDGRLARTAPATDPVDMPEPCTQRCGVGSLSASFRSHPASQPGLDEPAEC